MMSMTQRPRGYVLAIVLGGMLLAGCSSGTDDSGPTSVDDTGGLAVAPESDLAEGEARVDASEPAADEVTVLEDRAVVYRVSLVLEVDDVADAAQTAAEVATRYGGYVQSEATSGQGAGPAAPGDPTLVEPGFTDEYGVVPPVPPVPPFPPNGTSAVLVLRVPAESYTDAVTDLEALGETVTRTRTADDVTDQVVDVEARIETQEASIDRLQQLLDEAGDVTDVLAIETELTRRIAELESLQARLEQLSNLTDLATVTVTLYPPETVVDEGTGFVAGLRAGWEAFIRSIELGLTALGASLPFLAALALVVVPVVVWLVARHRRGRGQAETLTPGGTEEAAAEQPSESESGISATSTGESPPDAFASPGSDR
jgi:hypothetical protein